MSHQSKPAASPRANVNVAPGISAAVSSAAVSSVPVSSALMKSVTAATGTKILSPRTSVVQHQHSNTSIHHSALNAGRNERNLSASTSSSPHSVPRISSQKGTVPQVVPVPATPSESSVTSMASMTSMPAFSTAQQSAGPHVLKSEPQATRHMLQVAGNPSNPPVVTIITSSASNPYTQQLLQQAQSSMHIGSQSAALASLNNSVRGGNNYSSSYHGTSGGYLNTYMQQKQEQEPASTNQEDYYAHGSPATHSTAPAANVQSIAVPVPVPQQQQHRNLGIPYEIHVFVHVPVHGEMKEIEFAYDSRADTPELLAEEMAQEFGLDKVYQDRICKEIEDQVRKQTGSSTHELYRKSHAQALVPPRSLFTEIQQYEAGGQVRSGTGHANPSPQPPTYPLTTHAPYYQSSLPINAVVQEQSVNAENRTPVVVIGAPAKSVPTPPSDRSSPPHSGIYSRSAHDYQGITATMQLRKSGGNAPRSAPKESDIVAKTVSLKESKRESHGSSNSQSVHGGVPVIVVAGSPAQQARSVSVDSAAAGTNPAAAQTRVPILSSSSFSASGAAAGPKPVDHGAKLVPLPGNASLASAAAAPVVGVKSGVLSPSNTAIAVAPIQIVSQQQHKRPVSSSKSDANFKAKQAGGKQDPGSPQNTSRGRSETFSTHDSEGSKHNAKMFQACMALMEAVSKGNIKGVKARLSQGAPAAFADYDKRTPLHLAASEGHAEIAELLIQHGADIEAVDRWGSSPMKDALKQNHMNVVDVLEEAGAEREVTDSEIMSYELLEFSARGLVDLVRERLVAGISADTADYDKRTPLHLAASEGHADVVELLLLNGAKISAKDRYNRTPVDDAINNGHRAVLMVMQRFGASVPTAASEMALLEQTSLGMDLVESASKGRADVVQRLIVEGAPVDWSDYDKRSALHLAVTEGHIEVVQLLLEAGAQIDITDRWDKTPFDDARSLKDPEVSQQVLGLLNQKLLEKTVFRAVAIPKDSSKDSVLAKADIGSTITSVDGEDIAPKSESFESLAAIIPPSGSTDALNSICATSVESINVAPSDAHFAFDPQL